MSSLFTLLCFSAPTKLAVGFGRKGARSSPASRTRRVGGRGLHPKDVRSRYAGRPEKLVVPPLPSQGIALSRQAVTGLGGPPDESPTRWPGSRKSRRANWQMSRCGNGDARESVFDVRFERLYAPMTLAG